VTMGFRSYMTGTKFRRLIEKYWMRMVEQNYALAQFAGDVISVFIKPSLHNFEFRREIV